MPLLDKIAGMRPTLMGVFHMADKPAISPEDDLNFARTVLKSQFHLVGHETGTWRYITDRKTKEEINNVKKFLKVMV